MSEGCTCTMRVEKSGQLYGVLLSSHPHMGLGMLTSLPGLHCLVASAFTAKSQAATNGSEFLFIGHGPLSSLFPLSCCTLSLTELSLMKNLMRSDLHTDGV